ncbi:MAG TPA: putative peptidoglycan glycosyltransferase FtsW [Patescibacteria group bacterium]
MKKKAPAPLLPWLLIGNILLIALIGLLFVSEASVTESLTTFGEPYFLVKRQAMWLCIGSIGCLAASLFPLSWWQKMAAPSYLGAMVLLALLFVPGFSEPFNGARRWLLLGPIVVQPSEFMKLGIVLFFSSWLTKHQRLMPFLFLTALPMSAVLLQPDLGSMMVMGGVAFGLYYLAGGHLKYLLTVAVLGLILVSGAILGSEYRQRRLMTFLNPELDPLGASFHVRQITLALGRGGLFGQGIGNSQQRNAFLPEPSTDSIFAITAEEVGFVGALVIISLYLALLLQLFRAVKKQEPGSYAYLVGAGVFIWIGVQTLLNLSAVVALVPLTGVPLPLFSYGGSSLVTILLGLGIVIQLARKP